MDRSEETTTVRNPDTEHGNWLTKGYVLQGRYVIEAQLGAGGFGITYLAKHRYLEDIWVAIKEYLPDGAATRDTGSRVHVISERFNKMYSWGLHRFLDEARLLRQFNHPNIVKVQDFFEANNTAYMVMDYVRGRSLQAELDNGRVFDEKKLRNIIYPLLDALQCIHRVELYHRDISPDNILLQQPDDTPVLIDFGSARYAIRMHGAEQVTQGQAYTPTAIFKQGFSPIEQYEGTTQGPYTDIYALGATLYRIALGVLPADSLKRSGEIRLNRTDPLEPASKKGQGRFSTDFLKAIDAALNLEVRNRPQNIDQWLKIFGTSPDVKACQPKQAARRFFGLSPKALIGSIAGMTAIGLLALFAVDQLRVTKEDIPRILSRADKQLENGLFSGNGLASARNLYLQVLTLDQENTRALSGYSVTSTLKMFASAIEQNHLEEASRFLNKAESQLSRTNIDNRILIPARQRLQLRNNVTNVQQTIINRPLSAESWSDIMLLLNDMANLEGGDALAASAREALKSLRATDSAIQKHEFKLALEHLETAEKQLSPFGISKLDAARSEIDSARRKWLAERNAKISQLLATAEGHLKTTPLTPQGLRLAGQVYQNALDLDPKQPRARAGLSVTNNLLTAFEQIEKSEFTAATDALSDARQAAGNTSLWETALEDTSRQLALSRHTWLVAKSQVSVRALLTQAIKGLQTSPFSEKTLSESESLLKQAQKVGSELPELEAEIAETQSGIDLISLLRDTNMLLEKADFESARDKIQSGKAQSLSRQIGLGQTFLENANHKISSMEIEWHLSKVKLTLSKDMFDISKFQQARRHLRRVQTLDPDHTSASAMLDAIDQLEISRNAQNNQDFDKAASALQAAQPTLLTIGISEKVLANKANEIRKQQQAWIAQEKEKVIYSLLNEAVVLLQQQPFDEKAWERSEALFTKVAKIYGDTQKAEWGASLLTTLKAAQNAYAANRFNEAQIDITEAEKILLQNAQGDFEAARSQIKTAEQAWQDEQKNTIAMALAEAERALMSNTISSAVLEQAANAYRAALVIDSNQEKASAGLSITIILTKFLQALENNDFTRAKQYLVEASNQLKAAQLNPEILKHAENRLQGDLARWQSNQSKQKLIAELHRASELLSTNDLKILDLTAAEKSLQEAVALSLSDQKLNAYTKQCNAGLEAIILIRALQDELTKNNFQAAKDTLSQVQQRLSEAKLAPTLIKNLSDKIVADEIDWLRTNATYDLTKGLEQLLDKSELDKAESKISTIQSIDPLNTEYEPVLRAIDLLRQTEVARAKHNYDQAFELLNQASALLSSIGIGEAAYSAIKKVLREEQQRWSEIKLERNLNIWTGQAIDVLNRSPFDPLSWETAAALVNKIFAANRNDQRGVAVQNALHNIQKAKQAIDDKRFGDAERHIGMAQSELSAIGIRNPLENAYHDLQTDSQQLLQTQLSLATASLKEAPGNDAALHNARSALQSILAFQPDNPNATFGTRIIDILQKANAAIAATEFEKAAGLLTEAENLLNSDIASDLLAPQLSETVAAIRNRLFSKRPSPSEIYPMISAALKAISDDPLDAKTLNTAEKLLHNVLAMQSDQPTALAGMNAIRQLRIASDSMMAGAYEEARIALLQAERLFIDIGLRTSVLTPAWDALKARQ
jgi:serine/threonine protein kinase